MKVRRDVSSLLVLVDKAQVWTASVLEKDQKGKVQVWTESVLKKDPIWLI